MIPAHTRTSSSLTTAAGATDFARHPSGLPPLSPVLWALPAVKSTLHVQIPPTPSVGIIAARLMELEPREGPLAEDCA